MSTEKEKWMDEVFESMKGSQRARPSPELFAKIEGKIVPAKGKLIPIQQWRYAVAAAVLVLLVNSAAMLYYNQQDGVAYEDVAAVDTYSQPLITNYKIYE